MQSASIAERADLCKSGCADAATTILFHAKQCLIQLRIAGCKPLQSLYGDPCKHGAHNSLSGDIVCNSQATELTVWHTEPDVTHQTSWLESTGAGSDLLLIVCQCSNSELSLDIGQADNAQLTYYAKLVVLMSCVS